MLEDLTGEVLKLRREVESLKRVFGELVDSMG